METWQLLVSVAVLMVVYVVVTRLTGAPTSVPGLALAVVFGLGGWVLGRALTERLS